MRRDTIRDTIIYTTLILIAILPVIIFVIRFRELSIFNTPKDWLDFFAIYFSMLSLIVTSMIALFVSKVNSKNSRSILQYEAYKHIVPIIDGLSNEIKPMTKTNSEIIDSINNMIPQVNAFWQNELFIFENIKRESFNHYIKNLVKILNEVRKLKSDKIFGVDNNYGSSIINTGNVLIMKIQREMIR